MTGAAGHESREAMRKKRYGADGIPPMEYKLMCQSAFLISEDPSVWEGTNILDFRSVAGQRGLQAGVKMVISGNCVSVPTAVESTPECVLRGYAE